MNTASKLLTMIVLLGMGYIGYSGLTKATSYNESNRDNVIRNWQSKVLVMPQCLHFKDEFLAAGSRYDNATNGKFAIDMGKVWEAVKATNCAA